MQKRWRPYLAVNHAKLDAFAMSFHITTILHFAIWNSVYVMVCMKFCGGCPFVKDILWLQALQINSISFVSFLSWGICAFMQKNVTYTGCIIKLLFLISVNQKGIFSEIYSSPFIESICLCLRALAYLWISAEFQFREQEDQCKTLITWSY